MPHAPAGAGGGALQRAMWALNNRRLNEAEQIAGEVLKANPRDTRALHIFCYALLMQDRAADAVAVLEPAARSHHDPEIDTQLGMALRQAGRDEEALARLKRAAKRRPAFAPAFNELGGLLFSMRRYDEAIEAFRRGLEVAPMMTELSIQLGYVFLQRRNCADAKAAFARALAVSPGSHGALFGMGKAHQKMGENQAAAECFRRCLKITPDDLGSWLNLGHCLLALGERDAGYECFRAAARGDPKRYSGAITTLVKSSRGKFWLKPSAAAQFLQGAKR